MEAYLIQAAFRAALRPARILTVDKNKTISRNGRRSHKSAPDCAVLTSSTSQVTESDNDDDKALIYESDFILDENAFDLDLETEDHSTSDHTGKSTYIDMCKRLGVVPVSYYLRHMNDRQLNMRHHGLGPADMRALAEPLSSNSTIIKLDLSDNWLGPKGGLAVCEMLKENCFITELNLSENHLGTKCAPYVTEIMQQNSSITHLTLSGNEFDDYSAPYFADAILNTTKIQYLDLSHNNFGDVAGTILGPAIADNMCIKELDLSWNCFRRKGAVAVTLGIKHNMYMKKINLSWNGFGLDSATGLQDALKENHILEELDISNNRITAEAAVIIGKGLSANETLHVLKMGKNPMQSAGCYGICAALLCTAHCALKFIDFSDILVNNDFEEVYRQLKEHVPGIKLIHGGMEPPYKPKVKVHPMTKLANYIHKHDLQLIDFFNKFHKDDSLSVTNKDFIEGLQDTGIKLTEEDIEILLCELDRDGDGAINFNELVVSHVDFQENQEQISTILTVMQPRPMTT